MMAEESEHENLTSSADSSTLPEHGGTKPVLLSALYFAAASGTAYGVGYAGWATFRHKQMVYYTGMGGMYGFLLGGTFWTARLGMEDILQRWPAAQRHRFMSDLTASTVGGAIAGGLINATNGRSSISPAAIRYGLVGLAAEAAFSGLRKLSERPRDKRPILERLSDKSWWPLRKLSDAEYEEYLMKKLIAVEAQIEMVDERLAALKQEANVPSSKE